MCCGEAKIPTKMVIRVVNGFALAATIVYMVIGAFTAITGFAAASFAGLEGIGAGIGVVGLAIVGTAIAACVLNTMVYGRWKQKRDDPSFELTNGYPIAYIVNAIILAVLAVVEGFWGFAIGGLQIFFSLIFLGLAAMVIWDVVYKFMYRTSGLPYPDNKTDVEDPAPGVPVVTAPAVAPAPGPAPGGGPVAAAYPAPAVAPAAVPASAVSSEPVTVQTQPQGPPPAQWSPVEVPGKGILYQNVMTKEQLPLPPGFQVAEDPNTRMMYFIDDNTKTTSFQFPEAQARAATTQQPF